MKEATIYASFQLWAVCPNCNDNVDIAERMHDFKYGTASHYIDVKIKYEKD